MRKNGIGGSGMMPAKGRKGWMGGARLGWTAALQQLSLEKVVFLNLFPAEISSEKLVFSCREEN